MQSLTSADCSGKTKRLRGCPTGSAGASGITLVVLSDALTGVGASLQYTTEIPGLGTLIVTDDPDLRGVQILIAPNEGLAERFRQPEVYGFGRSRGAARRLHTTLRHELASGEREHPRVQIPGSLRRELASRFQAPKRGLELHWRAPRDIKLCLYAEDAPEGGAIDTGPWLAAILGQSG